MWDVSQRGTVRITCGSDSSSGNKLFLTLPLRSLLSGDIGTLSSQCLVNADNEPVRTLYSAYTSIKVYI
jgi:hypothetical protein